MLRRQSGMINTASDSLFLQHLCYGFRFIAAHAVDDSAFFSVAMDKFQNRFIFLFCLKTAFHVQADVGTVERGNEGTRMVQMQLPYDVFTRDFIRGGS